MPCSRLVWLVVVAGWCLAAVLRADEPGRSAAWRAGTARVRITPEQPIALLGYGDRTGPFESVVADIYAKALALEDAAGRRGVIVTADLVGFQAAVVTDEVCRQITARTGLERQQLLFNASHSHTGPLVSLDPHRQANSVAHPPLSAADCAATAAYTERLREQLVQLVCDALQNMRPVRLAWGRGEVGFPMNRRLPQDGHIVMADNPAGIVDRQVPVLRVEMSDGQLLAVLFGCACHNTTLTGRDNVIAGDYAGFAQEQLEATRPGTQAMFLSGCGADANPSPRGSLELARQHGATLAQEVERVLKSDLLPLDGNLVTTLEYAELPLQELSREAIQERTSWPSAEAVMAGQMLRVLDQGGSLPNHYRAPFAVWQLGSALTLVALPAEPVAEYVSLLQNSLGPAPLWVAGFNNDCFGYLPTARIVRERGHEAIGVTLWIWGESIQQQVGFFTTDVEAIVLNAVHRLAQQAGRETSGRKVSVKGEPVPAQLPYRVQVDKNVRITLRDGVALSAEVWRPNAAGRFPVLLQVSYYVTAPGIAELMAQRGYVCVLANSRGRGGSEGEWDPYVNEPPDVFDAQPWAGTQSWSDGVTDGSVCLGCARLADRTADDRHGSDRAR